MNVVVVEGNLTKNPEAKQAGETQLATFTLAVDNRKKKDGEWIDDPVFLTVEAWDHNAKRIMERARKGSQVIVSGRVGQSKWEAEGKKHSRLFLAANKITLGLRCEPAEAPIDDSPF